MDGRINLNLQLIAAETKNDVFLSQVIGWIKKGWILDNISKPFKTFFEKRNLLTVEFGCLMYNARVVIPKTLQGKVLKMLHMWNCAHEAIGKSSCFLGGRR
jgi:hypothetical protein